MKKQNVPTEEIVLTEYQYRQLISVCLEGNFFFKNEDGNKAPRKAWQMMIDALCNNGLIVINNGVKITPAGKEYIAKHEGIAL